MQNLIKLFSITGAMAMVLTAGTGCLKDKLSDNGYTNPAISKSPKVIELPGQVKATPNSYNSSYSISVPSSQKDTTFDIVYVRLAADQPASEDIKVQLELDTELLQAYSDSVHTNYVLPPTSIYSFNNSDLTITIPKGSRQGSLKIKVVPENLASGQFGFAFKIKNVSNPGYVISGNFNNAVALVGVRNKYDGVYEVDGTLVDKVVPILSSTPGDPYPFEVELQTTGPASVVMFLPDINDYYHWIGTGSVYGNFSPVFTFDPATDEVISVTNYYGQPSPVQSRSAEIDPSGANVFNADKSIDVKYFMFQGGSERSTFDEHFTYKGARD